jgi:hypothetical protein
LKKYPGSVIPPSYGILTVSTCGENNCAAFLKDSTPFSHVDNILGSDGFASR